MKIAGCESESSRKSNHVDAIILDHRVGEELLASRFERRFRPRRIAARELDVEDLALTHACDPFYAERTQRALDRLALRIENPVLQSDGDARFHGAVPFA